jgi:acetyl esterase
MNPIGKKLMVACCLLFTMCGEVYATKCFPLKAGNSDGNYIVPGVKGEIAYSRVNGVELLLDAYVQKRGGTNSRRPAVVIIHGGNWDTGSRAVFTGQVQELLTQAGYNWFTVEYRRNGLKKYDEAVEDLRAAVHFIRCNASAFRIDPNNIGLLGEDAGAHLALLLAAESPRGVKAVVSIGGFYDLREVPNFKSQISDDLLAQASPIAKNPAAMPPTLIVHGGNDREVPPEQASKFCESLRKAGRICDSILVEGAIHRAENWWPSQWGYKLKLTDWLAKTMRLANADHEPHLTNLKKDIVYSSQHNLKLDAWMPGGRGPFPAVILAHGGGWEAGDKVTYITPLLAPLAQAGFAWFSIDYRLTPQFRNQDQLEDLRQAIRFVRDNAKRFQIDPNRIAILGESASGQLVAQLATEKVEGVAAVVSFYGVYDFLPMATSFTPRSIPNRLFGLTEMNDEAQRVLKQFSPLYHVSREMPPLLLIQGTADRLHVQALALRKELERVGAAHEAYDVAGAPHGIENWEGHAEWLGYKQKLIDWLKKNLAAKK